MIAAEQRSIY